MTYSRLAPPSMPVPVPCCGRVLLTSKCWSLRGLWRPRRLPYKRHSQGPERSCRQSRSTRPAIVPFAMPPRPLLTRKGVTYSEIDIARDWERRDEMIQRSTGRVTDPAIFMGAVHVGGSEELHALASAGNLDPRLAGAEASP